MGLDAVSVFLRDTKLGWVRKHAMNGIKTDERRTPQGNPNPPKKVLKTGQNALFFHPLFSKCFAELGWSG